MAKRKPAQSKAKDKEVLQQGDDAASTAIAAIAALQKLLPDRMASFHLRSILTASASALCQCLKQAKKSDKKQDALYHHAIAYDLSSCAVEIASELLSFAHKNPKELAGMLESLSEWPAIVSLDPSRDIRKVLRNPKGMAAKLYSPILTHLNKNTWVSPSPSKKLSIFHYLAQDIAETISPLTGWAHLYRLKSLPWLLDFSVGSKCYALSRTGPSREAHYEWAVAIKYYLYLALAPEPERTHLREEWRNLRLEAFRLFQPGDEKERMLHRDLCNRKPLRAPGIDASSTPQAIHYPAFLWEEEHQPGENPIWVTWWKTYLEHEPAALFGNAKPLASWDDPGVATLTKPTKVRNTRTAAFGRCANAVLDAFLRSIGVRNGLKQIESRTTPIPEFGRRASRPEEVTTAIREMQRHYQNVTAKRR